MGYYLQALIGKTQTLETQVSLFENARLVLLEQDIAMIPLTDDLCEEAGANETIENFDGLSAEIEEWARQISKAGFVAYIEAVSHGGPGVQRAVGWNAGARALQPVQEAHAINRVLKLLGVDRENARDEFEAAGLGRHRDTEDWK